MPGETSPSIPDPWSIVPTPKAMPPRSTADSVRVALGKRTMRPMVRHYGRVYQDMPGLAR